jgi:uncharacterized protein with GYD domain
VARYMIQASYTSQGISDLVKNPQDRAAAVRPLIEGLGGKLESFDYAFGDYDAVVIVELPDNVSMVAASMAVGASGAIRSLKTTVLIPVDEAVEAMRKAGAVGYRPPGG